MLGFAVAACAATPSAQPPQMTGEYAVGGGEAFQSFTLGSMDASTFATAAVQAGGGVSCPSYWGEQPAPEHDGPLRRAARLLYGAVPDSAGCGPPGPRSFELDSAYAAFRGDVHRLLEADAVLAHGELAVLAADGDVVAFERRLADDRRVVVYNRASEERFLVLPRTDRQAPAPFTPVFASSGNVADVPALVAVIDEAAGSLVYGLRIPARTAVVFRPVRPTDVRPRGLDE